MHRTSGTTIVTILLAAVSLWLASGTAREPASPRSLAWTHAAFGDIALDPWTWGAIESLSAAGLSAGSSTTPFPRYCPLAEVSCAEMAVFLPTAVHGITNTVPPDSSTVLINVGHWSARWIRVASYSVPATRPAIVRPIEMEAVAAGDGALSTWTIRAARSMRKSSSNPPSGASACARTPAPPRRTCS